MAYYYNLTYSTGNVKVFLGQIDAPTYYEPNAVLRSGSTTALQFVGRNYSNVTVTPDGSGDYIINGYGSALNQNLVNLLQNFANTSGNLANTQVYPNFIPGQLVYVTSNASTGKTNQLFLTTASGTYGAATFTELLSASSPGTQIRNANTTTSSRVAVLNPNGPVVTDIDGTANVVVVTQSAVTFGSTTTANVAVNGNITMSGTSTFTGESANIRFMTNSNVAFSDVVTVANGIVVSNSTGGYVNSKFFTGTLTAAANNQPNIQQIGNMTANLSIGSGNVVMYAGNIDTYAGNIVVANAANGAGYMFKGDAGGISNIPGGQVVGNLPANVYAGGANFANYAGNITVAAQPNITSVGTLTSLTVTGLVTAGNINGGNLLQANYIQGTLTTSDQPNIGTLSNVTVTGNLTVQGNIISSSGSNFNAANGSFSTSVTSPIGNLTTVNSSNVNTTDIDSSTGNIDTLVSVDITSTNVFATTGNIATINATTVNTGNLSATGTVSADYGNFDISTNSPLGSFSNEVRAPWANLSANVTAPRGRFSIAVISPGLVASSTNPTASGTLVGSWGVIAGGSVSATNAGSYIATADLRSDPAATATTPGTITGAWTLTGSLDSSGNIDGANINTSGVVVATGNVSGGNITTAGDVDATGNVTGGNLNTAGNVVATGNVSGGNITTAGVVAATGNVSGGNLTTGGNVVATGNITGGNIATTGTADLGTVKTTAITTGAAATAGSITGTWTLTAGSKLNATYADLAEYYVAPYNIPAGTVVEFGGPQEIQVCDAPMSTKIAGVISTNPAFIMNEDATSNPQQIRELVALVGRVPCKVFGTCNKGDLMVSAGGGYAKSENSPVIGSVIGKALENKLSAGVGIIEIVVGRV